jgi:hypothetical protein
MSNQTLRNASTDSVLRSPSKATAIATPTAPTRRRIVWNTALAVARSLSGRPTSAAFVTTIPTMPAPKPNSRRPTT